MGLVTTLLIAELDKHNADPVFWPSVCERIADGATLEEMCEAYGMNWSPFRRWIVMDESREAAYQDALARRADYRREAAAANVMKIAQTKHARKNISVADTLKAADMVLGGGKQGLSINAGSGNAKVKIEVEFVGTE